MTPKAYVLANVTVIDAVQMAQYREWSTRAMQEHGAKVLARGGAVEVLEGDWTPERVVLLEFDSMEHARNFYRSETYTHARQLRENAGVMRMVVVEGVSPSV